MKGLCCAAAAVVATLEGLRMKKIASLCLLFLVSASTCLTAASKNAELEEAIEKLKKAGSYTWRTDLRIGSGAAPDALIEGVYNSTQGLYIKATAGKLAVELAARGDQIVAKTDGEWKPVKKFTRSDIDHSMIKELQKLSLPHHTLEQLPAGWRSGRKNTADYFEGQPSLSNARKEAASFLRQGGALQLATMGVSLCKAVITLSQGLPSRLVVEFDLSGAPSLLGGRSGVSVSSSTLITEVGKTQVTFPPEAEAALLAAAIK